MKKLLVMALLLAGLASAAKVVAPETVAPAGPTVQIKLAEDGDQLWCHIRFKGIEAGQTIKYRFRWSVPTVTFTTKKGEKIFLFADSVYPATNKSALVAGDSGGTCYCKDSGEKGCWRSKSYRTLKTTLGNGKEVRAVGTWKVEVLNAADDSVLGSLTCDVK